MRRVTGCDNAAGGMDEGCDPILRVTGPAVGPGWTRSSTGPADGCGFAGSVNAGVGKVNAGVDAGNVNAGAGNVKAGEGCGFGGEILS